MTDGGRRAGGHTVEPRDVIYKEGARCEGMRQLLRALQDYARVEAVADTVR